LTLGGVLGGSLAAGETLAVPLPTSLASATVKGATAVAAGTIVSAKAAALADGVIKTMFLAKLGKLTLVMVLAIACCGVGLVAYASMTGAQSERTEVPEPEAGKKDPPLRTDLERIQGTWKVVKADHGGKMLPREQSTGDEQIWVITEGKISIRYSDGATKEIAYRLDPKTKPKAVDVTIADEGGKYLGIYALEDDTLQFAYCRNTAPTAKRYTDFFENEFEDRGRRYFLLKRVQPGEKAQNRSKDEAAKLRKQFEAHADEVDIYLGRHGYGGSKIDLQSICLHSSGRRFEPSAIGPSGKPIFKSAKITKDQALKLMRVLDGFPAAFFRTARYVNQPLGAKEPFIATEIGYGPDSLSGPRLHLAQDWGWHTLGELFGIAECVDGDAAKIVRELIDAIQSEPHRPDPKAGLPDGEKGGSAKRFESLAKELEVFQTQEFAAGRAGMGGLAERFGPKKLTDSWFKAQSALTAHTDDVAELIPLLKHGDPKVRTLALAALFERQDPKLLPHIASLLGDNAKTAPQVVVRRAVRGFAKEGEERDDQLLPQDIDEQTVGKIAEAFLIRWLEPAAYTVKQFDAYWAERKERTWSANWFLARFKRASQNTTAFDKERGGPRIRAIRKDIDALPEVDRDWALLWVAAYWDVMSAEPGRLLATPADLIAAGKRLGPKRLMDLIQEKEIASDPDMAPRPPDQPRRTRGRDDMILWVLKNAGKLLRPEDAPAVLLMEDKLRDHTPWCAIAAAELQPKQAKEWLHAAMDRFAGKEIYFHMAYHRADVAVGLWRIVGASETDYLVDWFFGEKGTRNISPPQTGKFLEEIQSVRAPADRKLVARLVTDARFDTLDYPSVRALALVVNQWTKTPVIAPRDLHPNWESGTLAPATPADMQVIAGWRSKLRESVKEWDGK
jgi:uncharacterized protein (TIGR03067 family)